MRLCRFSGPTGTDRIGIQLSSGRIADAVSAAQALGLTSPPESLRLAVEGGADTWDLLSELRQQIDGTEPADEGWVLDPSAVTLHYPFRPSQNVVIAGENQAGTSAVRAEGGAEVVVRLRYHTKSPTAALDPGGTVAWSAAHTSEVYAAPQLAIVIGSPLHFATPEQSLAAVFGYSVALDVRAWDLMQLHGQWEKPISFDTFLPWGPFIVTADEVEDPDRLAIHARVNGTVVVAGNTRDALLGVGEMLAEYSVGNRIQPGDIFFLGHPHVPGFAPQNSWLADGDDLSAAVSGVGEISVRTSIID